MKNIILEEHTVLEEVHISSISPGDTIICQDGKIRTVCKKNIFKGGLFGNSVFGSSYNFGTIPVKRIKFEVPTKKGVVLR
jgi:hypothetical protein